MTCIRSRAPAFMVGYFVRRELLLPLLNLLDGAIFLDRLLCHCSAMIGQITQFPLYLRTICEFMNTLATGVVIFNAPDAYVAIFVIFSSTTRFSI